MDVCTHEHPPDCLPALATAPVMSADGSGVFALMNIYQLFSALRCAIRHQMVHGVFALMNICQIAVLCSAPLQRIMSADGSWSVCTHEHLPDSLFSLLCALLRCQSSADGSWRFALMNI
jgi:hypothetical protein